MGDILFGAMEVVCRVNLLVDSWLTNTSFPSYLDETIRLDREKFKNHVEQQGIPFAQTPPEPPPPSHRGGGPSFQESADRTEIDDILNALG
jgi:hypothetical protein